jgi:hypothetical protein
LRYLKGIGCESVEWVQLALDTTHCSCEDSNEPVGSLKGGEYDRLNNYQVLKKNSAPGNSSKVNSLFNITSMQVTKGTKFINVLRHLSSRLLSRNVKIKICKTIILPVVLYGCETLSLTLREEHRLRVFENRVLRRIFGPKRDEVAGGWRKLHNEELHGLYSSPIIVRVIKARRMR